MIKIAHEAPLELFKDVQNVTDYDYALANLYVDVEGYSAKFKQALAEDREVILDNAVFELGEAFDMNRFAEIIVDLKPTWYIIPDALEDANKTMYNAFLWMENYAEQVPGKSIGVVQGKTYKEIVDCYTRLDKLGVDMIAISFDYSLYEEWCPDSNKFVSWMMGRIRLLNMLERDKVVNRNKPHHLLGCALPQEGLYYKDRGYDWVYSMDTSNPVVHAIKGVKYEGYGLLTKESQKLFEMINHPARLVDKNLLLYNIREFRKFWNG
jgi:hypothetical protein